mmetsp:Transcript_2601/g.6775  ORF Transcript_2601/g.6775 Transcript_2601/m.6775 type:complete len:213 (+) Transcript_2601:143-781(+)
MADSYLAPPSGSWCATPNSTAGTVQNAGGRTRGNCYRRCARRLLCAREATGMTACARGPVAAVRKAAAARRRRRSRWRRARTCAARTGAPGSTRPCSRRPAWQILLPQPPSRLQKKRLRPWRPRYRQEWPRAASTSCEPQTARRLWWHSRPASHRETSFTWPLRKRRRRQLCCGWTCPWAWSPARRSSCAPQTESGSESRYPTASVRGRPSK